MSELQSKSKILLKKYFEENSIISSDIDSFNRFIDIELQLIAEENKEVEPTIIPTNVEEFKIRLDKITVSKPEITEADGSKRDLMPSEARLRKLSYSAPVHLEISAHVNGVQRESFKTQIGSIPIMLKSKYCHLKNKSVEDLIKVGEDPDDPGGYFIINGTEKVIVAVEDLASNRFVVEKTTTGISEYVGKIFSEQGSYKIPHQLEKLKDEVFYLSFTRVKRIPLVAIIKALGVTKDEEIMKLIDLPNNSEVFINLYEFVDIKTTEDAMDYVAKKIGITQSREIRLERINEIINKYLLPHIGKEEDSKYEKAVNLCKFLKDFILMSSGEISMDDKDHYANKRLKLSGDLLADLFRVNMKVLIGDFLYNFQRIVKRGKFPSIKVIIREKLLTQRMYSSMATGNWSGGRKGISQRIERLNFLQMVSALQRVISPLSASQENFAARALHPTHMGRLCMSETPEGTNIGLRKNLAILTKVTGDIDEKELIETLKNLGLETVKAK
ncbi:DNA-directed RNA polymerase subunit B'' [Candidatus Woesearchaeota archaeon]|nr:DNA-directed RNA polymerase subunit B'' [Candidatus Woesearchaeota archaeon]MCF8013659.1 DNA-directed RNA polymerase subunit B'' [Candidatus Woesearchaeota archaeon]